MARFRRSASIWTYCRVSQVQMCYIIFAKSLRIQRPKKRKRKKKKMFHEEERYLSIFFLTIIIKKKNS
jgi:hypothetical protein